MNPASGVGKGYRWGGGLVVVVGLVLFGLWLTARSTDRHGAIFLLGGAVFILLAGVTLWTIGYSLTMVRGKGE